MDTQLQMARPAVTDPALQASVTTLQNLQSRCELQETELNHAAENIETRGVKLLLKAYAQQRALFAQELGWVLAQVGENRSGAQNAGDGVVQGAGDIAASMTLGRENRRAVALNPVIESESDLLQAYILALQSTLPENVRELLERQRNQISTGYDRLVELGAAGASEPVTRVFDDVREAAEAIARLERQGFAEDYEVFDVTALPVRHARPQQMRRSVLATVRAGAFFGGLVGGLVGAAAALYQTFLPNMALGISVNPWIMFVVSALVGAFWGAVFGWFIGRNKVEEDRFIYEESLEHGARLVVVYPAPQRASEARRILEVHHDRELPKG